MRFDIGGFLAFMLFLAVVGLWLYSLVPTLRSAASLIGLGSPPKTFAGSPVRSGSGDGLPSAVSPVVVTAMPSAVAPVVIVVTATPAAVVPTATKELPLSMHRFSFYDPAIGIDMPEIAEVNCDEWNYVTKNCDSTLRNGERWQDNYFIAAACPYDLYMAGAYFEVVSPDWLVALFPNGITCKDTGDAVTGLFIDFLIPYKSVPFAWGKIPWGSPVALRRIR